MREKKLAISLGTSGRHALNLKRKKKKNGKVWKEPKKKQAWVQVMKFHREKTCATFNLYNVFKIQPWTSRGSAIIIFRIKPCYTFGHTKRLTLLFFTRPRARETCTHLSRIISDAWEKNFHETFSSRKTCIVRTVFHIGLLFHINHRRN